MNAQQARLAALADRAAASGITPEQFQQMLREEHEAVERQGSRAAASTADDRAVAAQLMVEAGKSEGEAWRTIAVEGIPSDLTIAVKQRQERMAAEAQEKLDRTFAASPEGRKLAAERAVEARQERARLVASARVLIEETPSLGLDAEMVSGMTEDEVLELSGIVQREAVVENPISIEESIVRSLPKNPQTGVPMARTQTEARALDAVNEAAGEGSTE